MHEIVVFYAGALNGDLSQTKRSAFGSSGGIDARLLSRFVSCMIVQCVRLYELVSCIVCRTKLDSIADSKAEAQLQVMLGDAQSRLDAQRKAAAVKEARDQQRLEETVNPFTKSTTGTPIVKGARIGVC